MTNGRGREAIGDKPFHHKPTQALHVPIQGSHCGKPSNNCLSHCTAQTYGNVCIFKIFQFRTTSGVSDKVARLLIFREKRLKLFQISDL